jgi:hypothetical protein
LVDDVTVANGQIVFSDRAAHQHVTLAAVEGLP